MTTELRILTVRQPWAWAIIHGGKDVENRPRNIAGSYRGPVAIHAGMRDDSAGWARISTIGAEDYPRGEIIGVVDLVGVHEGGVSGCFPDVDDPTRLMWCSEWADPVAQHLVLANPRPLTEPIPFKGALGLRRLDDDTTARILAQIGA